ncbi:MAG: caspase family protein, partial [Armatimonadota bacterium]|nr:caspase family protein [Armatimonadota bacterium]
MRRAIAILAAALALSATACLCPASAEKYALLVGINDYQSERIPDLRGAINDVQLMRTVLVSRFQFPEKNIRTLTDLDATKERIVAEFQNWLGQAGPNDVVYFHFSGHGSQATDRNGDEDDGMDETICPRDIRTDPRNPIGRDIVDDEMGPMIANLKAGSITIVFDSCHSGTASRGLDDQFAPISLGAGEKRPTLVRMCEGVIDPNVPARGGRESNGFTSLLQAPTASRSLGPGASRSAGANFVMISGCRDNETSADAPFQVDSRSWAYFGALTYHLAGALAESGAIKNPTYSAILQAVLASLKRKSFKQNPV